MLNHYTGLTENRPDHGEGEANDPEDETEGGEAEEEIRSVI
jgi:hypothetical protein